MKTICNKQEFIRLANEKLLSSVNANIIRTHIFSSDLFKEMKGALQMLVQSLTKPDEESYHAVISATCLSLWIDDVSSKTRDVSVNFYWDDDVLAFEVVNGGVCIWFSATDSMYNTSYMSKDVILCMISFLTSKSVSMKLVDSSDCSDSYIDIESREMINVFINGEKNSYPDPDDRLVKTFCLL